MISSGPPGACSFPALTGYLERFGSAGAFAEYLLEEALVAVVPGEDFGASDHVRLSYATSEKAIVEGLERIKQALVRL